MNNNIKTALFNIDMTYDELIEFVDEIKNDILGDVDKTIENINNKVESMTNEDIRISLLRLSTRSYSFSEIKEKSALKAELAESLRKEAYAKAFTGEEGTVAVKENNATLRVSYEIVAEEIHNLLSSLFKTKLDELHRVIDVLKTILMTRLTEAKLTQIDDRQE
jgi:hypothetical protein